MSGATGPLRVRRLSHLGVKVRDLTRALDFYVRVLGFEVLLDQRGGVLPGHETILGTVGEVAIELIHDDATSVDDPVDPDGSGWSCVCLVVDGLDAAVADLRRLDVDVIGPIQFPAARTAFFRDPDGNLLELIDVDLRASARTT